MLSIGALNGLVLGVLGSARLLTLPGGWESHGPPFPYVSDLAISPENELVVYAAANDAFVGENGWQYPSSVFRTSDGGSTWISLATAASGEAVVSLAIDPNEPLRLLASTYRSPVESRVYRTQDAGVTWSHVDDFPGCPHASIAFDSALPGRAYILACGALYRSDDGTNWTRPSTPLPNSVALQTGPDGTVYAVGAGQILRSRDHGDSWTSIAQAPTSCPSITAFSADPTDPDILYVGAGQATYYGVDCGGLFKSVDGGRTLSRLPLPTQFITGVVVDPTDPAIVYTCSVRLGIFSTPARVSRSLDAGRSWQDFSPGGAEISRLALSSSGRLLYGAAVGGVFRRSIVKPRLVLPRAAP